MFSKTPSYGSISELDDDDLALSRDASCWNVDICCHEKIDRILTKNTPLARFTIFLKSIAVSMLLFLSIWNITKLPYYLFPNLIPATDVTWDAARCANYESLPPSRQYWCHGLEGSVNVGHWHPRRIHRR